MKILLLNIALFWSLLSYSATIADTLYLNFDTTSVVGYSVYRAAFNDTSEFNPRNSIIELEDGDILELTIYNSDSIEHSVEIAQTQFLGSIAAGTFATYSIPFNNFGTYALTCSDFKGNALGAMTTIRVGLTNEQSFYWNLYDMNDALSSEIINATINEIPLTFRPNIYTINSLVYPQTTSDTLGRVTGNVNDTIYISIVNSGNMVHTLHFHGYHATIVQATKRQEVLNWEKDSFPVLQNESMTVRLIPDKEGMYPVHDHNLISVLNGGSTYPGGMITQLNIQP